MTDEDEVRRTGEWWSDPWWLESKWVEDWDLSRASVEAAFEKLKEYFPAEWLMNYKGDFVENMFLRSLFFGKSPFQVASLVDLSERLSRLEQVPGFRTLLKNLRSAHQSDAANMEAQIGDLFVEAGYEVRFPKPKGDRGKTPDVEVASQDDSLSIECKALKIGGYPA